MRLGGSAANRPGVPVIDPRSIDLRALFAQWYGPESRPALQLEDSFGWLPQALKDWYVLDSRRISTIKLARTLFAPGEIEFDGQMAVFMADPNEGWRWAFDVSNVDVVYAKSWQSVHWMPLEGGIAEFLTHHALNNLTVSPKSWRLHARGVSEDCVSSITDRLQEVALQDWLYPYSGVRLFLCNGLVVERSNSISSFQPLIFRDGYFDVAIAANSLDRVRAYDHLTTPEWFRQRPDILPPSDWPPFDTI